MRKKHKMKSSTDFALVEKNKTMLLCKIVDTLDDSSLKLTSCEIRMKVLDAIELI